MSEISLEPLEILIKALAGVRKMGGNIRLSLPEANKELKGIRDILKPSGRKSLFFQIFESRDEAIKSYDLAGRKS